MKPGSTLIAALIWLLAQQFGFCFYNPTTGRWLSRDLLEESEGPNLYGFSDNSPLNFVDRDGLQIFPTRPYNPPSRPQQKPPGPGLGDQVNPFGLRGSAGRVDYAQWFNDRFPKSVEGAADLLKQRTKEWIRKNCGKRPTTAPAAENGSEIQDVDIRPDMRRFGDAPQGTYERSVQIGFFEFRTDPAKIRWNSSYHFCFETMMYVEEQTGADTALGGALLFNKRFVRMGQWTLKGCGACPCDKYAH